MSSNTITGRIHIIIFKLLEKHPEGISWTDLLKMIHEADPSLHPKTVNGCVWKLVKKYPDKVHKPEKRLFQLKKFK